MEKETPIEVLNMVRMISLSEDEPGFHKKLYSEIIFCPEKQEHLGNVVVKYIEEFEKHYDYLVFDDVKLVRSVIFGRIFNELLKNAFEYGNSNDPKKKIKITVMFAEKGVMFSFNDQGTFFKSPLIKILFETKQRIPTSDPKSGNWGTDKHHIYLADKIFVSNEVNTVYVMKLFENIK